MAGIFQKLFGGIKEKEGEIPTQPLTKDQVVALPIAEVEEASQPLQPPQLLVGCAQSVGLQRDHNEDALFTLTTTLANDKDQITFGFYIVADGMGGHRNGEVASSLAIRAVAEDITQKLFTPIVSPEPYSPSDSIQEVMQAGVRHAHMVVTREVPGGGTTLTSILIFGEQLTVAHVGDSRAYLITADHRIKALTRDHSLVKRLVELGQITQDEAAVHPQRNVLYRALGQGEPFEADVSTSPLTHGSYLLLCSDGLWGVVPEEELARLAIESESLQAACQSMVDAANAAGGPDNITVILVRIPE